MQWVKGAAGRAGLRACDPGPRAMRAAPGRKRGRRQGCGRSGAGCQEGESSPGSRGEGTGWAGRGEAAGGGLPCGAWGVGERICRRLDPEGCFLFH